jgi:predicted metalloendopeptidase
MNVDLLGDPRNKIAYGGIFLNPASANAFYNPDDNSINLIPGLWLFPFYESKLPLALNFASYAYVIGHELSHRFDNNGRLYDGIGR